MTPHISADVKINSTGLVTNARLMDIVMTSSTTPVDASVPFQMTDSIASQKQVIP